MAAGEITPDEALTVTRVLDGRLRALKAAAREERILADSRRDEKKPSPGGRGNKCFRSRLLHSACILQSPHRAAGPGYKS
jgi:hypothetical protein